ncbi:hypothetical protein WOLCODRAFT_21192 [Wolfiporia cocos MD-104 SS10]|uniref:Uncharacterized protein n=1 Tax=Wolfiporia cocos (strain MD-104) TaxID=742152 RepID=A0A2H3JQ91_WOLCO|nr:hypothetical protein WOLCODRAFT_21192 [Wolfiporia cocos MD-104 SS10]
MNICPIGLIPNEGLPRTAGSVLSQRATWRSTYSHYTITNIAHSNRLRMLNEDDNEPVICVVPSSVENEELANRHYGGSGRLTALQRWQRGVQSGMFAIADVIYLCALMQLRMTSYMGLRRGVGGMCTQMLPAAASIGYSSAAFGLLVGLRTLIERYPRATWNQLPYEDNSKLTLVHLEQLPEQETLSATLTWEGLPPDHIIRFLRPLRILVDGEVIADAQVSIEPRGFQLYPADPGHRHSGWDCEYIAPCRYEMCFNGFQLFRNTVSINGIQLVGSDTDQETNARYLKILVSGRIQHKTPVTCTANFTVYFWYSEHRVRMPDACFVLGYAEFTNFTLKANDDNMQEFHGRFQPLHPPSKEVQRFISSYYTEDMPLNIKLCVENITTNICGKLFNMRHFETHTQIMGLGLKLIRRVTIYVRIIPYLKKQSLSFRFYFHNPTESELRIHRFSIETVIRGLRACYVDHTFPNNQGFVLSPKETLWSPEIPNAFLVGRFIYFQLLLARATTLNVNINAAAVSSGEYRFNRMSFDVHDVPFKLYLLCGPRDPPSAELTQALIG